MRRVALILVAILILGGCGGADGENPGALGTTGGSTAGSTTATRAASAAAGGESYCREWQVRSPTINRLAMKAAMGPRPADVKAALDGLDQERIALAAAAPGELKGDYQVLRDAWRHERDAAEQAGWSPQAFRQAAAVDLGNNKYLAAVSHNLTYLRDHCGLDLTASTTG